MMRSYVAITREIDDVEAAVDEILKALDIENNLLKNSLGIISCFSEFAETGVLKAVCDRLPFDCIGATSCLCSCGHETDQIIFTITVLTSDVCTFDTVVIPIDTDYENTINNTLSKKLEQHDEKPALFLSYFPLLKTIGGDQLLSAIDKTSDGIPLFGTVCIDHNMDYSTASTLHNGVPHQEAVVLGLIFGQLNCSFEVASIDEDKIRKQKAVITESKGNILLGVNGKTATEYLNEIGISEAEMKAGLGIIPLVIDHKDGTRPVARAVFGLTPDGYAICGGAMPVGTTLALGRISSPDVISTTEKALIPLIESDGVILSYSCVARYFSMGLDNLAEAEKMSSIVGDMNYLLTYSGGEICPLPDKNGVLKNYFHNFTNVFCKLS